MTDHGLSEEQANFTVDTLRSLIELFSQDDRRMRHFALMIFTKEENADGGEDVVSTNLISSLDRENLHEFLRAWLRQQTQ